MINWDALGAIGELLGSAVVLVTLGYLAIQTRSLNKQSQAEARYAFVEAVGQVNMVIAQSTKTASIWRQGLESIQELTEDERMQFFMFVGQYSNLWSVMHQLHEDKLLPKAQWRVVRNDIVSILGSDGGRYFWKHGGSAAFDPEFSEFVNSELGKRDRPYDMSKMTEVGSDDVT
jgi:hypothetical protein